MELITHAASHASGLSSSGGARTISNRVGRGQCAPGAELRKRALEVATPACTIGKVQALGAWRDPDVHARLSTALGPEIAPALRCNLEWYQCRGAFFHNDAHYDARLFGIWCIAGPTAAIVFPRATLRLAVTPGSIFVFDPFEVHGVLAPDRNTYSADDYQYAEPNIFIGFELDLTPLVATAFGIAPGDSRKWSRVISSRTRIAADSGALDRD